MTEPVRYHIGEFPPKVIDWPRLIPLIGPANAALARYDGVLSSIPNAAILLSPLTTQEAVLSSRIEGTNMTLASGRRMLNLLQEKGFFREIRPSRGHRSAILAYRELLNAAEGREVF